MFDTGLWLMSIDPHHKRWHPDGPFTLMLSTLSPMVSESGTNRRWWQIGYWWYNHNYPDNPLGTQNNGWLVKCISSTKQQVPSIINSNNSKIFGGCPIKRILADLLKQDWRLEMKHFPELMRGPQIWHLVRCRASCWNPNFDYRPMQ